MAFTSIILLRDPSFFFRSLCSWPIRCFLCLAVICLARFWLRAWPDSTASSCGFGSDSCNKHDVSGRSACTTAKSTKMEKENMAERIWTNSVTFWASNSSWGSVGVDSIIQLHLKQALTKDMRKQTSSGYLEYGCGGWLPAQGRLFCRIGCWNSRVYLPPAIKWFQSKRNAIRLMPNETRSQTTRQ